MNALEFEKKAIKSGLKIGFREDFQWVESTDNRRWCILFSDAAVEFANNNRLQKEMTPSGVYILYFIS